MNWSHRIHSATMSFGRTSAPIRGKEMSMKTSDSPSVTIQNLAAAFAGESMAHIKYKFFAEVCRRHGDEETARIFEATAAQEVQHAFGHMDLLFPNFEFDPAKCLELAIQGETYEYTEM